MHHFLQTKPEMLSKRFLSFSTLALVIYSYSTVANASEGNTRIGSWCSNTTGFQPQSSYKKDLRTLLNSLASKANESSNGGYYALNTTTVIGASRASESETVYGAFLCWADTCNACVSAAIRDLPPTDCLTDKTALIWYQKCMVRYSNVSFLGEVDKMAFVYSKDSVRASSLTMDVQGYFGTVADNLNELATELSSANNRGGWGAAKYFGTKNVTFSSYIKLYTMAQCMPDLAPSDCGICLTVVISQLPHYCQGSEGCWVLNPSCYARYQNYPFDYITPPSLLSPPLLPTGNRTRSKAHIVNIALGMLVLFFMLLLAILLYLQCIRKNKDPGSIVDIHQRPSYPSIFQAARADFMSIESLEYDLATLQNATDNFSAYNKLGEGGFGSVYKGVLPNGLEIAVKRLSKDSNQGADQLKNEVVFIAKLQHRNLVQLLGYCLVPDEKLLVYEFVPQKSLDLVLFDSGKQGQLDWSTRYKIIQGIARGILYLHEDSRVKIVHRDLKASNILLDAKMNPKISDFGLARNFDVDQKQDITNRPAGTLGYMAPEYLKYGEFSTKTDVYSFGVLVLEIISGRKVSSRTSRSAENLLAHAWKLWNEDNPYSFVDDSLGDSYSRNEVIRCLHLGLLCVHGDIEDRPSMTSIVSYLNSNLVLPALQDSIDLTSSRRGTSSGTLQVSHTTNKTGSSSRASELLSHKSTNASMHSFSGIEV